ncbi:cytochrome P450 3A12 isoform X1 [Aplysia californica]|uniref:Cytochrome P450 3A12 isoform X1 n=1 Tax=Aplysia californica TaxID=6500 RepID=A0ABM0ZVU7_APLCA|nr:cytochrome P450 3A12 isoform X1 [Aplysia californica]
MIKEITVKKFSNFTDKFTLTDRSANHPLFSKMLPFARGAEWKRMRSIVNPAFSSNKLKSMENYIGSCSKRLANVLNEKAEAGEKIDTRVIYGSFTLDMIAEILFGVGMDTLRGEKTPLFHHATTLLNNTPTFKFVFLAAALFPILRTPLRLMGYTQLPKKNLDFFVECSLDMVGDRKKSDAKRLDFLQLLLNAESQDRHIPGEEKKLNSFEICAQLCLFFVAGYETTANTMQFLSHSLAKHPEVQEKLIAEIESCLGDEEPNSENLVKLTYMDAVISETLRLYPPIPYLTREAFAACEINGFHMPAGTGIFIPTFAIGRDEEFFPEPEKFKPERFLDETSPVNPLTVLAFGFGPRQCIGMRLAMKEIKIALVYVLRKVKFVEANDIEWPKTLNPTFLQTANTVLVRAEKRSRSSPHHDL